MASRTIYILISPALKGLLKIGKATRTAEERAAEISNGTGVPTRYLVAYDDYAEDCDRAERLIHAKLSPYRYEGNREFFDLKLKDALPIVMEVIQAVNNASNSEEIKTQSTAEKKISVEPRKKSARGKVLAAHPNTLRDAKALTPALPITVRRGGLSPTPIQLFYRDDMKIDNRHIRWQNRSYSLSKISTVYVASMLKGGVHLGSETYFLVMKKHDIRSLPEEQNLDFIQSSNQSLLI